MGVGRGVGGGITGINTDFFIRGGTGDECSLYMLILIKF